MCVKILSIALIVLLMFVMIGLPVCVIITEIRNAIKERKKGDL